MGAWGAGAFENDTAVDWTYDLEKTSDLSLVAETLGQVTEAGDDLLDADLASEALAACEAVARLKGNWGPRDPYTETVDKWVAAHPATPSTELVAQAVAVIDRVSTDPSELLELWKESADEGEEWLAALKDLRARVLG